MVNKEGLKKWKITIPKKPVNAIKMPAETLINAKHLKLKVKKKVIEEGKK